MKVDGTNGANGDSENIGANDDNNDPLETIMMHWSYNGGNVDNSANGNNGSKGVNGVNGENNSIGDVGTNGCIGTDGFIGTSFVIGTNGTIEWRFYIRHCCH